jgi:crossover junction endonuclease EME1
MKEREIDDDDNEPFDLHESRRNAASSTTQLEYGDRSSSDLDLPDVGTIASQASNFSSLSRADSKKTLAAYESEKIARQKKREKVRKTQEKLELKEAEKERRRVAREEKKKDKEMAADLAKVNTLRIDKKVSTPQMIVDLPTDLDARLVGQVRQFLEPLEVECKEWNNPIPNVVKWRRKVDSVYNEELGHWEPVPKQIKSEKHVMCFMTAKEFVDLTMADEGRDLDAHFLRMKARFDECSIIYLVEGLTAWMRKNRNVKNRQFTEAVRSQMSRELEEPSNQKGKKKKQQEYVDEDMIEDSLLRLQVIHGAQIHHTAATVDTAQWIMIFTQHISTTPYR